MRNGGSGAMAEQTREQVDNGRGRGEEGGGGGRGRRMMTEQGKITEQGKVTARRDDDKVGSENQWQ